MKKKTVLFCLLLCLVAGMMTYKAAGSILVRNKTYGYLEQKGYSKSDISGVEIKHSFLNKLLSYNEWRIFVTFQKEPDIVFAFTYRNGEILRQGVTGEELLGKDEILDYEEKLESGAFHIP